MSYVDNFINSASFNGATLSLTRLDGTILNTSIENFTDNILFINSLSDLPSPSASVIMLESGKSYYITDDIDLLGNRLETSGICNILGASSETSYITSTGLTAGVPLLTSRFTIPVKNITFRDVDTAIYIDDNSGAGAPLAIDWLGVNFLNVPNVGEIGKVDNFIFQVGSLLNSNGLRFTGEIGTIAIESSLLRGNGATGSIIEISSTANITRRFRIIYSSIIAFGSTIGIDFSPTASVSTEAYILDTINFAGGGTFIDGVLVNSNKTLFINCVGISNTSINGQLFMKDNATATIISNTTDFVKAAGTTLPGSDNEKYTATDNRLTNDAVIQRKYLVQASLSFDAGNNNECEFGFYDSVLDDINISSISKSTANAGGKAENVHLMCVVKHNIGDYIEVWGRNTSSTQNITVSELNLIITEIK